MPSVLGQLRKPSGPTGEVLLRQMNERHSALTDWGLEQLTIRPADAALDIGCGGGRTVQKLAARAGAGRVWGVDFSETSVAAARALNADAIAAGHVAIEHASVEKLPFPDAKFDVVTAVETHYYWPDLDANFREVLRVLKPGGTFLIIIEAYRRHRFPTPSSIVMRWLLRAHFLTVAEHVQLLTAAGFVDVKPVERRWQGWLAVTARRAMGSSA